MTSKQLARLKGCPVQFARRCIPPFSLSAFLFLIDWLIWSAGPRETPQHRPDSFICSPQPGDSRVPAARAPAFVCPRACTVCPACVCRMSACQQRLQGLAGGWGGRGGLILGCISAGAGLGHINILINMQESITGEARA